MQKVNQFYLVLASVFFFALLATPMSAQVTTRQGTLQSTTTTSTKPSTSVDVVADEMKILFDQWERAYNMEKSTDLAKLVASQVTIAEPDGDTKVMTNNEFEGSLENDFIVPGSTEIDLNISSVVIQPDSKPLVVGTYTERQLDARGNVLARKSGDFIDKVTKEGGVWKIQQITVVPN